MGLKADDGFFTIRMLDFSRIITRNLKGANPDDTNAEIKWLKLRKLKSDERFIDRTKKSELAKNKKKLAHRKKSKTMTISVPRKRLL